MERQWNPQNYEATSKWGKVSAYEVIDHILWHGDEIILDVGTGDGKICSIMSSKVPLGKVVGIDISKEMINHAKKHFPPDRYPNLSFFVGSAEEYKTNERFDMITSFTMMHLVLDQRKALQNFMHLLKPGGHLILKFPNEDGFATALERVIQLPQWKGYFVNFSSGWFFHTKEEYTQLILKVGFKLVNIEQGLLDECYNSPKELADAVREWLPHLQMIPQEEQDKFLADLLTLFLQEVPPDEEDKVHHYEPFLFVEVIKNEGIFSGS